MLRFSSLLILLLATFACEQSDPAAGEQPEATVTDSTITLQEAEASKEAAAIAKTAPAVPELSADFPEDQLVSLNGDHLAGLCDNQYGCLQETLYPLGWSPDGKFAYLLEEANEAVQNTTIHLRIQDMDSDEILEEHTFKASEQPGWTEDTDNYSVMGIWRSQETLYDSLLQIHQIRLGVGTQFYPLVIMKQRYAVNFTAQDKLRQNVLFDIQEVDQHWLVARKGERRKTICKQTMGKYDLVIASQPLGGFHSPFEERLAVVDGLEKRGYEGPPNVLRLQLVGCDLEAGFE